jgi:hypothetical protein
MANVTSRLPPKIMPEYKKPPFFFPPWDRTISRETEGGAHKSNCKIANLRVVEGSAGFLQKKGKCMPFQIYFKSLLLDYFLN